MGTCEGGGMCVWKESGLETQSWQQEKQLIALCNSSAPGPWQEGAGWEGGGDRRRETTVGTQSWMGPVLWRLQPPRPPRGQVRHTPSPGSQSPSVTNLPDVTPKSLPDPWGPHLSPAMTLASPPRRPGLAAWINPPRCFSTFYGPFKSALWTKLAPFLTENILCLILFVSHTHTPEHISVELLICSSQFQTMQTALQSSFPRRSSTR